MTLVKFEPLREFESFQNKLQRFFNDFPSNNSEYSFSPNIDISEDENHIYVEAEIPGVKKENIDLSLDNNILTIKGEKKSENKKESKDKTYFRNERGYGSFTRSFTLPSEVNPDNVKAKFEDGILNVTLDKAKKSVKQARMIEIK